MAIPFYRDTTTLNWIVGEHNGVPAGDFRMKLRNNDTEVKVISNGNSDIILNWIAVTDIEKASDGSTYTDLNDLLLATRDFFVDATGDGGRITFVPSASPFATVLLRNTWAAANLTDLLNNADMVTVVTVDDGTSTEVYEWGGANQPASHDPSFWVLRSGMSGIESQILTGLDGLTDGQVPQKNGNTFIASALTEGVSEVVSSKPIRADIISPTSSIAFEDASILSTNTESLEIEDCVRNDRHEIITSDYDDTGSNLPSYPDKSAIQTFQVQLLEDTQATDFNVVFPTLDVAGRDGVHFSSFIVKPRTTGMLRFVLRNEDSNGCILNTETTRNITVGMVGTDVTIPLANRVKLFNGQNVWVSVSGVELAGHQFTADPTWGNQFVPRTQTMSQNFMDKPLATQEYVRSLLGNEIELTGFSMNIASRVDVGTNLNIQRTVTYTVSGASSITSVSLQLNGTDIVGLTVPTNDGVQTENVTLSGVDTSSATTLRFRVQANDLDNSNAQLVEVRNLPQSETIYYGVSATNNAVTIDPSTLTSVEAVSGTVFNADFDTPNTHWDIILVPNNLSIDIVERTFNAPITTDFTKVDDARTISGQLYDTYVHQNNSGTQGILATTITVS